MFTSSANTLTFNLLYVEDDPQTILVFNQEFGGMVNLHIARTAQQALAILEEEHSFDLIVLNDALSGSTFWETVQSTWYLRQLPIILLTTRSVNNLTATRSKGQIIDTFSYHNAQSALRARLNYLIRKKQYAQTKGKDAAAHHVVVRMPLGKRLFDIAVSFTALLLISPLLVVVAALVRFDSKGPVFYRSKRVGMGYRVFHMYKFRTMRTDADKMLKDMAGLNMYGGNSVEERTETLCAACQVKGTTCQRPLYLNGEAICEEVHQRQQNAKATFSKFKEDPRVTRLGRFLRNTSIDELPQLFNIVKGDMSFVGNRPLPPYEAEKLTTIGYARRFAAPAGLTGLWQVTKRGRADVSDLERIQLDVLYAKKYSFKTDLIILLRTVKALWQSENV